MLWNDGDYLIYNIQHKQKDGSWGDSSFAYFGQPIDYKRKDSFSACGECWQQTGIQGTYYLDAAKEGLKNIRKNNPKTTFRLVAVYIKQGTVPLTY